MTKREGAKLAGWFDGQQIHIGASYANDEMVANHERAHADLSSSTADGILLAILSPNLRQSLDGFDETRNNNAKNFLFRNSVVAHEAVATYRGIQYLDDKEDRKEALSCLPEKYVEFYKVMSGIIDKHVSSSQLRVLVCIAISTFIFSSGAFKAWTDSGYQSGTLINNEFTPDWRLKKSRTWLAKNIGKFIAEAVLSVKSTPDFECLFGEMDEFSIDYIDDDTKKRERGNVYWHAELHLNQHLLEILLRGAQRDLGMKSLIYSVQDYNSVLGELISGLNLGLELQDRNEVSTDLAADVRQILQSAVVLEPIVSKNRKRMHVTNFAEFSNIVENLAQGDNKLDYDLVRFLHPQDGPLLGFHFYQKPEELSYPVAAAFFTTDEDIGMKCCMRIHEVERWMCSKTSNFFIDMLHQESGNSSVQSISKTTILYCEHCILEELQSHYSIKKTLSTFESSQFLFGFHSFSYVFCFDDPKVLRMKVGLRHQADEIMAYFLQNTSINWIDPSKVSPPLETADLLFLAILMRAFVPKC